jgi:hypothetical protein
MEQLKLTEYQQAIYDTHIVDEWSTKMGNKTTVVTLVMRNGYEATGTSACTNPEEYEFEIGEHYARVRALEEVMHHISFMRQQESFERQSKRVYKGGLVLNGGTTYEEPLEGERIIPLDKSTRVFSNAETEEILKSLKGVFGNFSEQQLDGLANSVKTITEVQSKKSANEIAEQILKGMKNMNKKRGL